MELTDLPNIGPVLAANLRKIGVETPEALREVGAAEAFLRIRRSVDGGACLHQLTALAGAELGLPKAALPPERKAALILVLDKKLSKLFIAPQARQELMRRLLRQTAAKGRR